MAAKVQNPQKPVYQNIFQCNSSLFRICSIPRCIVYFQGILCYRDSFNLGLIVTDFQFIFFIPVVSGNNFKMFIFFFDVIFKTVGIFIQFKVNIFPVFPCNTVLYSHPAGSMKAMNSFPVQFQSFLPVICKRPGRYYIH